MLDLSLPLCLDVPDLHLKFHVSFELHPRMVGEFMLPSGIEDYLFGSSEVAHFRDQPNVYLDSVNAIYLEIRRALAAKATGGELTPRQILTAKKIIFQVCAAM